MKKRHHITLLLVALVALMVLFGCSPSGPEKKEEAKFMTDEDIATLATFGYVTGISDGFKQATTEHLDEYDPPVSSKDEGEYVYSDLFSPGFKNENGVISYVYTIPFGDHEGSVITSNDGVEYTFDNSEEGDATTTEGTGEAKKVSQNEMMAYTIYDAIGKFFEYYSNVENKAPLDGKKPDESLQTISFSSKTSDNRTARASIVLDNYTVEIPAPTSKSDETPEGEETPAKKFLVYSFSGDVQATVTFTSDIMDNLKKSLTEYVNKVIADEEEAASEEPTTEPGDTGTPTSPSTDTSDGKETITLCIASMIGNLPDFNVKVEGNLSVNEYLKDEDKNMTETDKHVVELDVEIDSAKYSKKIKDSAALLGESEDIDFSGFISLAMDLCTNHDISLYLDGTSLDITQSVSKILFKLLFSK